MEGMSAQAKVLWAIGLFLLAAVGARFVPKPTPTELKEQATLTENEARDANNLKIAAERNEWRDSNLLVAKNQILKILNDPDSAMFRDMTVIVPDAFDKDKAGTVCGYVNSKNAFGGYAGYHMFMVIATVPMVDELNGSRSFHRLWNRECANKPVM